jgi:hypothetical protein
MGPAVTAAVGAAVLAGVAVTAPAAGADDRAGLDHHGTAKFTGQHPNTLVHDVVGEALGV